MATSRLKKGASSMSMDEAAGDNRVAALLPVNNRGEIIDGADPWQMPAGPAPDDDQGLSGEFEEEPETPTDRVLAMLSDVSDDPRAYVKISRLLSPGKFGWCDDVQAAEFEAGGLKMIRDKWGAGDYQIVLYGQQPGTKRFVIRTRATVQIVGAPAVPGTPVPQFQQNTASDSQVVTLLERVLAERPALIDPMTQMTQMLTMMKLMRDATGPTEAPKNQLSDTLALIKELKGATKLFEGGSEDGGMMGMVKDMLPAIAAMAAQNKQPEASPQVQRIAAPVRPQAQHPEEGLTDEQIAGAMNMTPMQILKLRGNLAILVAMAQAGATVEEGAEHLLDSLPDEMLPMLDEPQWWVALTAVAPALKPFEEWAIAVRALSLEILDSPEDSNEAPANQQQADAASIVEEIKPSPKRTAATPKQPPDNGSSSTGSE